MVIELNRLRPFGDGSSMHALPVGTFAMVGVVGHVLCGGYGVLGRQLGWASDNVVRFELVNASGDVFAVSAEQVRARKGVRAHTTRA
jgi:FAD/FMN-containing dehydrogenase